MAPQKLARLSVPKARTGIEGFDHATHGGLPRGRTTLVEGAAGCGKTILALQTLVTGAKQEQEPGIFVAFEEGAARITANAATFSWDLPALQERNLFFLDAQPSVDLIQAGSFDLGGILAALEAKVEDMGAKRIVFDGIDVVLALLRDPTAERREVQRLHDWLLTHELTAIITTKVGGGGDSTDYSFLQFMVDCAVTLRHEFVQGVSTRNVRVLKYRGSAFQENDSPFVIGNDGLEVAYSRMSGESNLTVSGERVSSGIPQLDAMLGGGYYRCSSVLVTGFPGTAKTTLAGAFIDAACQRGEHSLFVSFDSDTREVVRNLTSVNIHLERFVESGLLQTKSARTLTGSPEIHLMRIRNLVQEQSVRCLVIDPLSALAKSGSEETAHAVAERLIDWAKDLGITLLCTSLLQEASAQVEGTPLQVSTIADTWIHLNYLVEAGERNRGLSIIKSRGTGHSNQVRELILSGAGVTLTEPYTAGGGVLMGTLRWEKERAVQAAREAAVRGAGERKSALECEETDLELQLRALQRKLEAKRAEKEVAAKMGLEAEAAFASGQSDLHQLRVKGEI